MVSSKYGIDLNQHKCVDIIMNEGGDIHFQRGDILQKKEKAQHFGNIPHKT